MTHFPPRAVYNAIGQLVAEYSTQIETVKPQVSYLTTDHLGSSRVLTNKQGEVVSRRDFMPFGEEIVAMAETHRTPGDKYGVGDGVRQKFTGYERDEETGLDFAEARYYYNNHGRFTAVDPLLASGKSADPQTFNRYAYTMNRPLILTDPTGLQAGSIATAATAVTDWLSAPPEERSRIEETTSLALVNLRKEDTDFFDFPLLEDGSYDYFRGEGTRFFFFLTDSETGVMITDYTYTMNYGDFDFSDPNKQYSPNPAGMSELPFSWVEGFVGNAEPGETPSTYEPDPDRPPVEERSKLITIKLNFPQGNFQNATMEIRTTVSRDENGTNSSSITLVSCTPCEFHDDKELDRRDR